MTTHTRDGDCTLEPWPTHPDGRPKRMGELTPEQQRYFTRRAVLKLKRELESPAMQRAIGEDSSKDR